MKEKPSKFSNFTKKYCNVVQLGLNNFTRDNVGKKEDDNISISKKNKKLLLAFKEKLKKRTSNTGFFNKFSARFQT